MVAASDSMGMQGIAATSAGRTGGSARRRRDQEDPRNRQGIVSERAATDLIVHRVLVVEDDRQEAEFLQSYLSSRKLSAEVARDAGQAHSTFTMRLPDAVVLELILPNDVTGFEVCERMKRENRNVPVIVLTEIDRDDARDLATRVGADGYLTKPYDPEELVQVIFEAADRLWKQAHLDPEEGSGEKVRFLCGGCGKKLKVNPSHRGKTLNCPRCGQTVTVPRYG
jgi:two-component system, OmpR family, response regulator